MKNRWIVTMLVLLAGTPVRADLFNKSYAVVIGISKYQHSGIWKTLDNAENDARAMDEFLTGQGFEVKRFVGQQATMRNIISYLEDVLAPRLTRNDRFVFYFSGHGDTRSLGGRDWGYLIPYDGDTDKSSTWIDVKQITYLSEKLGTARHQLFILDSCFGGLIATKGSGSTVPEGTPEYIAKVTAAPARQCLTAGGANEKTPANSNLDGYREYSYFTAYLLKGLREGAADRTPDGFITTSELYAYLQPAATTEYNTPREGELPGHEQGDFVFRSPKPAQIRMNDPVPVGPTKGNDDEEHWRLLSKKGEDGLKSYLLLHPDGKWADEARDRLQSKPKPQRPSSPAVVKRTLTKEEQYRLESAYQREQRANSSSVVNRTVSKEEQDQIDDEWGRTKGSGYSTVIQNFLDRHPVGTHVPAVQQRLAELRASGR